MRTTAKIPIFIASLILIVSICLGVEYKKLVSTIDKQNKTIETNIKHGEKLKENLKTSEELLNKITKENEELNQRIKQLEEENKKAIKIPSLSRGGDYSYAVNTLHMRATAYGSSELNGGLGTNKTCIGTTPEEGRTIAVDPSIIPLKSRVYIFCESYPSINGVYTAEDTGGAIKGDRVDVYFDDVYTSPVAAKETMDSFGIRNIILYVLSD